LVLALLSPVFHVLLRLPPCFVCFSLSPVQCTFVFLCVRLFKRWCNPRQGWCLCVGWPTLLSVSVFSSSPVFFCVLPLFIRVRSRFSPFFFSLSPVLLFPFLVLCPVFSVQDEDNGGKSTRRCWLMDQNFPLVLFLSVPPLSLTPSFVFVFPPPRFCDSFPWLFYCLFPPCVLCFLWLYSHRIPPLPGNQSTVIARVMVAVGSRGVEEDEQCCETAPFFVFCVLILDILNFYSPVLG